MRRRTASEFDVVYENVAPWDPTPLQNTLESEYGPPPYEFLSHEIPFGSVKRKRHNILPDEYRAKYPFPNYTAFKNPQYFDTQGREYKVADPESDVVNQLVSRGESINTDFDKPDISNTVNIGTLAMWIRIPIATRNQVQFPNESEIVHLFHIETQVAVSADVETLFHRPLGKTGYILMRNFITHGRLADPAPYYAALRLSKRSVHSGRF